MTPIDILIIWGIGTFIIMLISVFGIIENSASYERDERKVAARTFVLAPVWPLLLMVWLIYGFYYVVASAFTDEKPQPMYITRRLWMEMH